MKGSGCQNGTAVFILVPCKSKNGIAQRKHLFKLWHRSSVPIIIKPLGTKAMICG
jgi:hypothetical protein